VWVRFLINIAVSQFHLTLDALTKGVLVSTTLDSSYIKGFSISFNMPKQYVGFYEEPAIIQTIDAVALQRGTTRSSIIRYCLRRALYHINTIEELSVEKH
jgi:hypothetical protein